MEYHHTSREGGKGRLIPVLTAGLIAITAVVVVFGFTAKGPKIAYVRSSDLIGKYTGTVEARQVALKSQEQWKLNLDTLHNGYRNAVDVYNAKYSHLTALERKEQEQSLTQQEEQVSGYAEQAERMAAEEEHKLMEGVLGQINSFAVKYGKDHGYDLVFGTTADGSIIYGDEVYDITDEVLAALNADYRSNHAETQKNN